MMKKFLTLALAALLVLSAFALTSCEKVTAYALVSRAIEKTEKLDSVDADISMDISMSMMGMTIDAPTTMSLKAKGLKSEDPVFSMLMTMEMMGIEVETDVYYADDYYYITMLDESYKMKEGDLTEEYDAIDDMDDMMQDIPEELLRDVEVIDNGDGTRSVSLELTDAQFSDVFDDFVGEMNDTVAEDGEVTSATLTNCKVTITVDSDGYVASYDMSYDMKLTMSAYGQSMDVDSTIACSIKFNNPGDAVTVTPPEGYQSFEEITE